MGIGRTSSCGYASSTAVQFVARRPAGRMLERPQQVVDKHRVSQCPPATQTTCRRQLADARVQQALSKFVDARSIGVFVVFTFDTDAFTEFQI